jgi:hypothetical protein
VAPGQFEDACFFLVRVRRQRRLRAVKRASVGRHAPSAWLGFDPWTAFWNELDATRLRWKLGAIQNALSAFLFSLLLFIFFHLPSNQPSDFFFRVPFVFFLDGTLLIAGAHNTRSRTGLAQHPRLVQSIPLGNRQRDRETVRRSWSAQRNERERAEREAGQISVPLSFVNFVAYSWAQMGFMDMFKKKDPKDLVREWQSKMRTEMRGIDRQVRGES